MLNDDKIDDVQKDFLRKTVAIMKVLTEEAIKTAERFVKACGRTVVTGNDMYYSLMYEAHEFFNKDIDERFMTELTNEREHTYETDEEEEDEETSGEEDVDQEKIENFSIECIGEYEEKEFHSQVLKYADDWRNWFPDDPVKLLIKNAIDKTKQDLS